MAKSIEQINEQLKHKHRKEKLDGVNFRNQVESYDLRPAQEGTLEWIKQPIIDGKKFFILEMPTGVGKSIFSQAFINYYLKEVNSKARFDILTNTKILQEQYFDEFQYMNNLWGKKNYECETWGNDCEYGKTCNTANGKKACEDCPHSEAFKEWKEGQISLTNFHTHGIFSLFNKQILDDRNPSVLIVDEAHLLEEVINGYVSLNLSKKTWQNFVNKKTAQDWENDITDMNTIEEIVKWIEDIFLIGLKKAGGSASHKIKGGDGEKYAKIITDIERITQTIMKFLSNYKEKASQWVADKRREKGAITWSIQPLWTADIMKDSIWGNYKHIILMSGTIIDSSIFCETNGIDIEKTASMKMGTPFHKDNRPIYYMPTGRLSYKQKESSWKQYPAVIKKILKKYEGKKGIIHTGNYELWQWLKNDVEDDRLIFAEPGSREISLKEHLNSTSDTVLVSPSMIHGIDLKDDYSRFQIIIKVPYPSLASEVNKQRFKQKPKWYSWRTVMDIIQAYGRSIRNDNDYADTIILDSCFSDVISQNSAMFPKYFLDAVKKKK